MQEVMGVQALSSLVVSRIVSSLVECMNQLPNTKHHSSSSFLLMSLPPLEILLMMM